MTQKEFFELRDSGETYVELKPNTSITKHLAACAYTAFHGNTEAMNLISSGKSTIHKIFIHLSNQTTFDTESIYVFFDVVVIMPNGMHQKFHSTQRIWISMYRMHVVPREDVSLTYNIFEYD